MIRLIAICGVATAISLAGCGGSDSGSSSSGGGLYTGKTDPAPITSQNATSIAADSVGSSTSAGRVGASGNSKPQVAEEGMELARRFIEDALDGQRNWMSRGANVNSYQKAVVLNLTQDCLSSGSSTVQGSIDDETFQLGTATLTYNSCDDGLGESVSGTITVSYAYANGGAVPTSITMTVTSLTSTTSTSNTTLSGTIVLAIQSLNSMTMTTNVEMSDSVSGESAKLENFIIDMTDYGSYAVSTISGTAYSSAEGSYTISTSSDLYTDNQGIYAGVMVITGANGSSARVTVTGYDTGTIEVDEDGDGTYETTITAASLD